MQHQLVLINALAMVAEKVVIIDFMIDLQLLRWVLVGFVVADWLHFG